MKGGKWLLCVMVKIWDRGSLECVQVLQGHTGSVLCLQYDETVIISGSSDATVRSEPTLLLLWLELSRLCLSFCRLFGQ